MTENKNTFPTTHRGTIPPQLFKYVNRHDMAAATREFIDFMNDVSVNFNRAARDELPGKLGDIKIPLSKLFGQDVKLQYVASGSVGTVYKMQIGDVTLALKLNRYPEYDDDVRSMDMHRHARTLIRRPYIGATYDDRFNGGDYSWVVSDYIEGDDDGWTRAKEKLFNAAMTKGLRYSDLHSNNIRDGRIIDLPGLSKKEIDLSPSEIDLVKKLMNFVRMRDTAGFEAMAARVAREHPDVMQYMYLTAAIHSMEMPMHYQPFYKLMRKYNDIAKTASETPSPVQCMMNKNQRDD